MIQANYNNGISGIPEKKVLVFGCGNILFGDDGYGPRVAEELLENYHLPENVKVVNAGTSIRNLLFDITLSEKKPEKEIFELPIDEIPLKKIDDFSMHQLPTSNLLKELKDFCKVDVIIIACQIDKIPTEVSTKISKKLLEAIPEVCNRIIKLICNNNY
jgi:coenzyme F420 hydrogenase subunit delta